MMCSGATFQSRIDFSLVFGRDQLPSPRDWGRANTECTAIQVLVYAYGISILLT